MSVQHAVALLQVIASYSKLCYAVLCCAVLCCAVLDMIHLLTAFPEGDD